MDTSKINLLTLIEKDTQLKKVAGTRGGEYHGACPRCGGKDRFAIQPHLINGGRWMCRQCSPTWQDAISYVRWMDGCSYGEALATLGLSEGNHQQPRRKSKARQPLTPSVPSLDTDKEALTSDLWQAAAKNFCSHASDTLQTPSGKPAIDYLLGRGLSQSIIESAGLGWNSQTTKNVQWGECFTKEVPRGIVIPWLYEGRFWRVKIRRTPKDLGRNPKAAKYPQVTGGANGLYFTHPYRWSPITPDSLVIVCEGELDALILETAFRPLRLLRQPIIVATGGAQNAKVARWVLELAMAHQVVFCFDNDDAGKQAAAWWTGQPALAPKSVSLCPIKKDIGEMFTAGINLMDWFWDTWGDLSRASLGG